MRRSALVALRADRAEQGLGSILAEHHDLGSLLASAMVNVELLTRTVDDGTEASTIARELDEDLRQVRSVVAEVKVRALGDLSAFDRRRTVHLGNRDRGRGSCAVVTFIMGA